MNFCQVLVGKIVVVAKGEGLDGFEAPLYFFDKHFGFGDAAQSQCAGWARLSGACLGGEGLQVAVADVAETDALMRIGGKAMCNACAILATEVGGTFRDDDDVCSPCSAAPFPQISIRYTGWTRAPPAPWW